MPTPGPHRHGPPTLPNQTTPRPQRSAKTLRTLKSLSELLSSWLGPLVPPDTANFDLVVSSPTWYLCWNESHPSSPRRGHFWISRAGLGAGLTLPPPSWTGTGNHGLRSTAPDLATQLQPEIIWGPGPQSSCLSISPSPDCKDRLERLSWSTFVIVALKMVFLATSSVTSSHNMSSLDMSSLKVLKKPLEKNS